MKDYIALVTVELHKFARQIASLQASGAAVIFVRAGSGLLSFAAPRLGFFRFAVTRP